MTKLLLICFIITNLVACGAAKNSKSRSGENPENNPPDRDIQPADSDQLQKTLRSHMFRNKESQQLSFYGERDALAKKELPKTHRTIPDAQRDVDTNVVRPEKIASPEAGCGNYSGVDADQAVSIKARYNNCKDVQGDINAVTWFGKNKAINGEGFWRMIANSSYTENEKVFNKIIWQDLSTALLWSDLSASYTWEEATGITNKDSRPCLSKSDTPKHELGRIHPSFVTWRMPNRNEFLQADLNGSRFVLPNTSDYIWTASFGGTQNGVDMAWAIKVSTGELKLMPTSTELATRCIGVIIK